MLRTTSVRRFSGLAVALALLLLAAVVAAACGGGEEKAGALPDKITVFTQAVPANDALWMAQAQGFFKEEGLNVELVVFASGTTASESFRTGQGDIITTGDLPAINNWFTMNKEIRIIAALERDTESYWAVAKKEIQKPQDLVGKKVGTRVGSTGSYFVDIYLKKNGVDPKQVEVLNLDPPTLVPALDRGDIAAFFIWEPYPTQAEKVSGDKVRRLTSAKGYVVGYSTINARLTWLQQYPEAATRFLRAVRKGAEFAKNNKEAVIKFFKDEHKVDEATTESVWKIAERPVALDQQFYQDFCQEFRWAQSTGIRKADEDLVLAEWAWRDALRGIDAKLAPEPSGKSCPP